MSMLKLPTQEPKPVTIDSLGFERNLLNLSTVSGSAFSVVSKTFPKYATTVSTFYSEMVKKPFMLSNVTKGESIHRKLKASGINYTDMGRFTVFTPPGMKVSYVEWLTGLRKIQDAVVNLQEEVLVPFNNWLGELVNDRTRFNSRSVGVQYQKIKMLPVDALSKELNTLLDRRETTSMQYNKALKNHAEWEKIIAMSEESVISLGKSTANGIQEQLNMSIELLDALSKAFEDLDTREKFEEEHGKLFNGGIVRKVSDMSYQVAQVIEFYTVVVYYSEATTQAINDSVDKVRKMIRQ